MLKNKKFLIGVGVLLAFFSVAVWATSASVSWVPSRYAPYSIEPGSATTTTVTFTNNGPSTINGKKLLLEVRGDATSVVSVTQPNFPTTIKKGDSVSVNLSVQTSSDMPMGVIDGTLVLLETKPNGSTKDVFKTALPIEITISPFLLPPDPGEEGEATIEGIDLDENGVRDDIDRYIAFTYSNSEKVREALKQEARALTPFLRDADDKVKTRVNGLITDKAFSCLIYTSGNLDVVEETIHSFLSENVFLNTKARSRAYWKADQKLGGTVTSDEIANLKRSEYGTLCTFNPDSLPN